MGTSRTFKVAQESKLGGLGLQALVSLGVCGPPCDLSDLKVRVYIEDTENPSSCLEVSIYDMSRVISPRDKDYAPLRVAINELERAA